MLTIFAVLHKDRGNTHIQLIEDGRLITDSIDVANLLNNYFIHAVPTHMPNLQPEALKMHLGVIAIEQKLERTNKLFIHFCSGFVHLKDYF